MPRKHKVWYFGFRRDFRLWYDHFYYDGDIYTLNLGWVYFVYMP